MMLQGNWKIKKTFKIISVDHVAVATKNIKTLENLFVNILGMDSSEKEYVVDENVDVVKIFSDSKSTAIELLEAKNKDSVIEKYIDSKGEGIHHIALNVDDIQNAINFLKSKGVHLVYEKPNLGADNKLITFIHPKSSPGMLIELCQKV